MDDTACVNRLILHIRVGDKAPTRNRGVFTPRKRPTSSDPGDECLNIEEDHFPKEDAQISRPCEATVKQMRRRDRFKERVLHLHRKTPQDLKHLTRHSPLCKRKPFGTKDVMEVPQENKETLSKETSQASKEALSREWTFYADAPKKAQNILQELSMRLKEEHMTATNSPEKCDFILAVCPVVSRLGVDVERCGEKLKTIHGTSPAILVVVHFTFRPDYVVPDSKKFLKRDAMLVVDLLFDENQGFLCCDWNNTAFDKMTKWIRDNV